jgi:hypothetical protein
MNFPMKNTTDLTPHYEGSFEAFRTKSGEQYARLQLTTGSYVWFKFDFDTESYQSFDFELFPDDNKKELQKHLEDQYQELTRPMREYLSAIYQACTDE